MKINLPPPHLVEWIRSNSSDRIAFHSLALKPPCRLRLAPVISLRQALLIGRSFRQHTPIRKHADQAAKLAYPPGSFAEQKCAT
jgi:hypothetical protein